MKPLWHLTVHDELYSLMHGSCNIPFNGGRISGQGLAAKVNICNYLLQNLKLELKSSSGLLVTSHLEPGGISRGARGGGSPLVKISVHFGGLASKVL